MKDGETRVTIDISRGFWPGNPSDSDEGWILRIDDMVSCYGASRNMLARKVLEVLELTDILKCRCGGRMHI